MTKPGKVGRSTTNLPLQSQARDDIKNDKNNNKKQSYKDLCCPFACPTCQSLGGEWIKSRYEIVNILSDSFDSIYSPMHEQYHDYDDDHRSIIRNSGGKVFLSADLMVVDSFFQQQNSKK
jgi:hypothetical protein